MNKFFIYLLVVLITAYPAFAADVSLNRWVLNVTLHDDGVAEEVIQAELENGGASPLDGISFVVPASGITIIYGFSHTFSSRGQVVEQQAVPGGTKIIVQFNESIKTGEKWNGRLGFTAENWAVNEDSKYSIDIPVEAPKAIVSGQSIDISVPADADIRSQVFLPKSFEVTSVTPKPFRILFQYGQMVPTWSPDTLHTGDTISVKSSFSDVLDKIVEADERSRELAARINDAKAQGTDVSDAEAHLENAGNYNNNQALASFWKKENDVALEFVGYANDELARAENSLSGGAGISPDATENATPGFAAAGLIMVLLFFALRKK